MRHLASVAAMFIVSASAALCGCMTDSEDVSSEDCAQIEESIGVNHCGSLDQRKHKLPVAASRKTPAQGATEPVAPTPEIPGPYAPSVGGVGCSPVQVVAPSYEGPQFQAPTIPAPSFGTPTYKAPEIKAPHYQAPSYQTPAAAPRISAPTYQAPHYAAPVYEAPVYEAPEYPAPSYEAPIYHEPTYEPSRGMAAPRARVTCKPGSTLNPGQGSQYQ